MSITIQDPVAAAKKAKNDLDRLIRLYDQPGSDRILMLVETMANLAICSSALCQSMLHVREGQMRDDQHGHRIGRGD